MVVSTRRRPNRRTPGPQASAAGVVPDPPAGAGGAGRVSLVDRAYHEIRRRILDSEYPQGHQVLEQELAAELGMSRTPIREALVRLQTDGFVQLVPRHGMRVVPLSIGDVRDMSEVLTALELAALERLARSAPDSRVFDRLDEAIDAMDLAARRRDPDGWVEADERFHRSLVELCGNARLTSLVNALRDQGHRARITTVRLRASLEASNQEHRAVADAIRRGDWREARSRHRRHCERTGREIVSLLEQYRLARR